MVDSPGECEADIAEQPRGERQPAPESRQPPRRQLTSRDHAKRIGARRDDLERRLVGDDLRQK
jgi:hypothetical protein